MLSDGHLIAKLMAGDSCFPISRLLTFNILCQDLVEDSEDDRGFDEISETAPPIELPAAELARLEVLPEFS